MYVQDVQVQRGEQGQQGIQGIPGEDGHTPVITISNDVYWTVDGEKTSVLAQGPKGEDGVSVVSVIKTGSEGLIDTYTITYSDGHTSTFVVTNGAQGAQGEQGQQGEQGIQGLPGEDGHTPVIEIGANGHWYVDNIDTGRP